MLWPGSLLFAPHTRFLLGAGDEETDGGESGTVVTGWLGDRGQVRSLAASGQNCK